MSYCGLYLSFFCFRLTPSPILKSKSMSTLKRVECVKKGKGVSPPPCRRYSLSVDDREHRATKEWNESTPLGKLHEEGVQCSDVQPREEWEKDCGGSNGITPLTSTQ